MGKFRGKGTEDYARNQERQKEKYYRYNVAFPIDWKEKIERAALIEGITKSQFIIDAVREKLEKAGHSAGGPGR